MVYAFREDSTRHKTYRDWLEEQLNAESAFGVSPLVLSGFLRVVTNRRAMKVPTPLETALRFCDQLTTAPQAVIIRPGPRHWGIFTRLCRETNATANHVPDAYLAALAIEHGCEWITADRGFGRYPGLRWRDSAATPWS
jgi:toxin-antitoxin system PIN domain toxin